MKSYMEYIYEAYQAHWALGQFNITSLEVLQGVIAAGEKMSSPLLIGTSMGTIHHLGLDYVKGMVDEAKKHAKIPVYIHLDHGTYDMAIQCIERGYDSVMIDASQEAFEDNVRIVSEVAKFGQKKGVAIEGQIGRTLSEEGDEEGDVLDTDPKEAEEFVRRTGVDTVAVQIGNTPGIGGRNANIDLSTLEQLYKMVKVPIILHGGSSVPDETLRRTLQLGIAKINIDRALREAVSYTLNHYYKKPGDSVDPRKPMSQARDQVEKTVMGKIQLFGSVDKCDKEVFQ